MLQEVILFIAALVVFVAAVSQPLVILIALMRQAYRHQGFGPYRDDALPDKVRSQQAEIEELTSKVAKLEDLVKQLWERNESERRPPVLPPPTMVHRMAPLAVAMSVGAVTMSLVGPILTLPSHTGPEVRAHTAPTMHVTSTSGGESLAHASRSTRHASRFLAKYCFERETFTVIPFEHVRLMKPIWLSPEFGDRVWTLWFFPEKEGPAALQYVLN